MVEIINKALGPRVVWEKTPGGGARQRVLQMGETADLALANPKDPVLAAWKEAGEVVFGLQADEAEDDDPVPPADADLDDKSDDDLRVLLAEKGVKTDGRWSRNRLLTEAEKVKG